MATAHPPAPFALAPLAPPRKQTRPWLAWCPRRPLLALALALLAGCGSTTPPAGVTAVTPFSLECQSASNSFQVSASKFFQLLRLI